MAENKNINERFNKFIESLRKKVKENKPNTSNYKIDTNVLIEKINEMKKKMSDNKSVKDDSNG